ncbi:MAG: hypothetical protein RMJ43_11935 [Chloroherpetonaceae bacterium]|nr:hypothetical protein [Chthonomonadaceae bacterium]MDW8208536.1 hypothetical protein [Chloroherpetonaceae bacterium]
MIWKEDIDSALQRLRDWWDGRGVALHVTAPAEEPRADLPEPPPADPFVARLDPQYRVQAEIYRLSRTFFGGVALPVFNANVGGPGSLGLFLGAEGHVTPDTVWYEPCITDPDAHPPLECDPQNFWWQRHLAVIDEALRQAEGRYLVGMPDLVENLDTLAQLRGPEQTLMDLVERPEWVQEKIREINRAYYTCFDALWERIHDPWGGNAFHAFQIWGPGKTAKVQCDFSCMISPKMFRQFVLAPMAEQCAYLDYAMYHLDGTQALPQLPNLLSIDTIRAIEWTPQAGLPGGGSPEWYDLYRQIRAGGKSVQAIGVLPQEVEPLIEAVGGEGIFLIVETATEAEARSLLQRVYG